MFLSSRWGKPSYEIEALPLSEFNKQKAFWEHCPWGMIDDISAMHHAAYIRHKTGGKSNLSGLQVKNLAIYYSSFRKAVVESAKSIRAAFMGIASAMKEKK